MVVPSTAEGFRPAVRSLRSLEGKECVFPVIPHPT
jgi:hypothetical protein